MIRTKHTKHKVFIVRFLARELFWFFWMYLLPVLMILIFMGSHLLIFGEGPFGNRYSVDGANLFVAIPLFYWGIIYCLMAPFRWAVTVWKYYYDKGYESKLKVFEPTDKIESFKGIKLENSQTLKDDFEGQS